MNNSSSSIGNIGNIGSSDVNKKLNVDDFNDYDENSSLGLGEAGIEPPKDKKLLANDKKVPFNENDNKKPEGNEVRKQLIEERASFKNATLTDLNDKSFYQKTIEVLNKVGEVLWTPFNTEEKRQVVGKAILLALAVTAFVAMSVASGGAADALIGLAALGLAIATLDFGSSSVNYYQRSHEKAGMRFAGDVIASGIYYLGKKIIDKMYSEYSDGKKAERRETLAKASYYISSIARILLGAATVSITGIAAPLDPSLLQLNTHDKLVGGGAALAKTVLDVKLVTGAVPKEPVAPIKKDDSDPILFWANTKARK